MKKKAMVFLAAVFCAMFLAGAAQAEEKFASVDIVKIVNDYNKAKDFSAKLEEKAGKVEKELVKKEEDFKKEQDKFNLLNDQQKKAKGAELEKQYRDLEELRRQKTMELRKEDFDNSKIVAGDIKDAIENLAKKENYTLVFDSRILIYQGSNIDITEKIVKILNANAKDKK